MCVKRIRKNIKYIGKKMVIDWSSSGTFDKPYIELPCGKCIECQRAYSSEWATRIMLEASKYERNCFLTLTWKDNPISLSKRPFQLFMKRLRKALEKERIFVKFFACGEYGGKRQRPHYHVILLGWSPPDLEFFFYDKYGCPVYKSEVIAKLWGNGFISVGKLTHRSAIYCAKYLQKLVDYQELTEDGVKLEPPFVLMSKGIAKDFAAKVDYRVDKIYINGKSYPVPRYFDKINEKNGFNLDIVRENRKRFQLRFSPKRIDQFKIEEYKIAEQERFVKKE